MPRLIPARVEKGFDFYTIDNKMPDASCKNNSNACFMADIPRVPLGQGRSTVTPLCACGQDIPLLSVRSQKRLLEGGRLTAVGSAGGSGCSTATGLGVTVMCAAGLWAMVVVVIMTGGVDLPGCSVDMTSETVGTVGTGESPFV